MKRLVVLLFATCTVAYAGTYRWVDENGTTVYSQTLPPGRQAETLRPPPPPAESPEQAQHRLDEQVQKADDYLEDKQVAAEKARKAKQEETLNRSNCATARGNLSALEVAGRRLVRLPDGSYARLTEEQRQARMDNTRKQIERYCK